MCKPNWNYIKCLQIYNICNIMKHTSGNAKIRFVFFYCKTFNNSFYHIA